MSTLDKYHEDNLISILHHFVCDDKTLISTSYVCDGMADCNGTVDELYCKYFSNLYYPSQLCSMIRSFNLTNLEWICPMVNITSNRQPSDSCNDLFKRFKTLTFDFLGPYSQLKGNNTAKAKHCVYEEPNICGMNNSNGEHLISCDNFTCPDKYFKCPGFYCLPWRLVCNGEWECPGGTDEMRCQQRVCSGMFKCKNSSICINEDNLCDSVTDCHLGDDESFCLAHQPNTNCPANCSCLLFSLSCDNTSLTEENTFRNYVSIYLNKINEADWPRLYEAIDNPVIFSLKHSQFAEICNQKKRFLNLRIFDLSNNVIHHLESNCFRLMSSISYLNISRNKVNSIAKFAFYSSNLISELDLSWNNIERLRDNTFAGLCSLRFLSLISNNLLDIGMNIFSDTNIGYISTENFKICCVKVSVASICPARPQWPNSCGRLLGDVTVKVFIWLVGSLGYFMNIFSCIILLRKVLPSGDSYNNVITCLSVSDALYCIPLLTIVSSDIYFGNNYLQFEHFWRTNFFCIASSMLSIVANFLSVFTINLLTLTRYLVVRNPLDSRFLDKNLLTKVCIFTAFALICLSVCLILAYIFTSENQQLPTGLCLLIGSTESSSISQIVTILTMLIQGISCLTIPLLYYFLMQTMAQSKKAVETSSIQNSGGGIKGSILVAFTNLSCWIPSSVLLFMTVVWNRYPYVLLIWTTMVVIPLNTVINPFVFVFHRLLKHCMKENLKPDKVLQYSSNVKEGR